MTWIRLDDGFSENPKVLGLSPRALRLHVFALCYAGRNNSDGKVPAQALQLLHGSKVLVDELVKARLWHQNGTGWEINDFLVYNPSRDETEERRRQLSETRSKAGKSGAAKRWQADSNESGK